MQQTDQGRLVKHCGIHAAESLRRYIEEMEPPTDEVVELWQGFVATPQQLDPDFMEWTQTRGFSE